LATVHKVEPSAFFALNATPGAAAKHGLKRGSSGNFGTS
jgi:hypothetical protein